MSKKGSRYPKGRLQCTGTAKTTGARCRNQPVPGRETCPNHGGLTPSLHRLKNGLSSKLPSRIAESYQHALADPTLLDQGRSIALMEALAEELAERIKNGDTPELRLQASRLAEDAFTALSDGRAGDARARLKELLELLEHGSEGDQARDRLFAMADRIGARRDAAWATKLQRSQVVNASDIALMLGMLLQRARTRWGEAQARELAEMFEGLLGNVSGTPGPGVAALAAVTVEAQTVGAKPA